MIVHNVTQRGPDWFKLRAGIPTASEFHRLMTPKFEACESEKRSAYVCEKLAEKVLGYPLHSFGGSGEMEQGNILEEEAIPFYEFRYDTQITRVGFCTTNDGRCGCSPDGVFGKFPSGSTMEQVYNGIEIKCPQIHTHVQYLLDGGLPKKYAAQVHGSMYVTGAPQWTFMSYNRKLDPLIVVVKRDPEIMAKIDAILKAFYQDFDAKYAVLKDRVAKKNDDATIDRMLESVSVWPRAK